MSRPTRDPPLYWYHVTLTWEGPVSGQLHADCWQVPSSDRAAVVSYAARMARTRARRFGIAVASMVGEAGEHGPAVLGGRRHPHKSAPMSDTPAAPAPVPFA